MHFLLFGALLYRFLTVRNGANNELKMEYANKHFLEVKLISKYPLCWEQNQHQLQYQARAEIFRLFLVLVNQTKLYNYKGAMYHVVLILKV